MMKKILALVLVLALAMGALSMSAMAATDSNAYEVGYAKVDINPYWYEWQTYSQNKTFGSGSAIGTEGTAWPHAGEIPYEEFYTDPGDIVPLPMGGYGNNDTRLSRPKLMDDNGSGVGAGTTKETLSSSSGHYYKKSGTTWTAATSDSTNYPALFNKSGSTYTVDPEYQDVHLSNNRYTKDFAIKLFGEDTDEYNAYKTKAGITSDADWGENDGDGVWATCVFVHDPQSNAPMLIIGLDNISIESSLVDLAKTRILAKLAGSGLTEDRIMINANHTHGSVALGSQYNSSDTETFYVAENYFGEDISFNYQEMWCFLNFYKNFICNQMAAAALAAYNDRETALTMEKGTIDASEQTGYQLNGVRHSVQTFTSTTGNGEITYVRGSSFNNDMNGDGTTDSHTEKTITGTYAGTFSKSEPVTASNDRLQILKFTFENKEPIAMVNFRAHSTANNKQAQKLLHYNISADWVSPLRYDMENAVELGFDTTNYRFSLLYGNSGNLGTGHSNGDNDPIISSYANYVTDRDGVSRWQLPATPHGRQIAQAALALLKGSASESAIIEDMHAVKMGLIQAVSQDFTIYKQQWTELQYAAALKYRNNSDYVSNNATAEITVTAGETITNGSYTVTPSTGGTYTIASKYHANAVVSKYNVPSTETTIELNAFRLGNAVAFATNSIEASDRYFTVPDGLNTNAIPAETVNALNDWTNLVNASWGVPFDLSLTNGSDGYIPNSLAYVYNSDTDNDNYTIAIGSYESQTSYAQAGTGELMVAALSEMMTEIQPDMMATCKACGEEVEWLPLTQSLYTDTVAGHYYLDGSFTGAGELVIPADTKVCLELNGGTLSASARAFTVNGTLNIQDSSTGGTVQGTAVAGKNGGTILVNADGAVNQYSGTTVTCTQVDGAVVNMGGVVYVKADGSYTLHDGTITGGKTTGNGGNVWNAGTFLMKAGTISDGTIDNDEMTAYTMGGNVFTTGTFTMESGSITGGEVEPTNSKALGGNVQVQGGTFTMKGGSITGGDASTGDNVCTNNSTFRMEGGYIGSGNYIQEYLVLTGTTDGDTAVNMRVRNPAEYLTIEGTYTGKFNLTIHEGVTDLSIGSKIGNATNNADISDAQFTVAGLETMSVAVVDSELQLTAPTGSVASVGNVFYDTVGAAVSAYSDPAEPVVLLADAALGTLTKNVYVDLNGFNVTSVTTGSYKLYCLDAATDDFVGATYGTVPAGTGIAAAPGYLAVTEDSVTSFHKYEMEVTHVVLNPTDRSINYKSTFKGDQKVKEQIKEYGIAMRAYNAPNETSIWADPDCKTHTAHTQDEWVIGDVETAVKSVGVTNIISPDITDDAVNKARSEVLIYGRTYILLESGEMLFGEAYSFTMQSVTEHIDTYFNDDAYLDDDDRQNLVDMYTTYRSFMQNWNIPNIVTASGENDMNVL